MKENQTFYYITDWNVKPGHYTFDKHRFPQGYIELMPWYCVTWKDVKSTIIGDGNIVFANTPVHNELAKLKIIEELINKGNKVIIIQEGNFESWYDWPADAQELYIKLLDKCVAWMCDHAREKEASIYTKNLLFPRICANTYAAEPRGWGGDFIYIVNPIKRYQTGMVAHKIVYDYTPKDVPVCSHNYIRPVNPEPYISYPDAYKMPGFTLLDGCTPDEWLERIYRCKFGVNITRDHAGDNTILEFASMGIPIIGNQNSFVQKDLFPDISFDYRDAEGIGQTIRRLLTDKIFYNEVAFKAYDRAINHWGSTTVVNEFKQNLQKYIKI
tara:strand:+ start:362 stop:1342 length:981 start_codon:yes stop_codon:yes gene_type:complete